MAGIQQPDEDKPSDICRYCGRVNIHHADDGKCFFEATHFEPYTIGELVDYTMEGMAEAINKKHLGK